MVDMYASSFTNVQAASGADQWKNYLAFAVDGNSDYTQIDVSGIDASGGMSNGDPGIFNFANTSGYLIYDAEL